MNVLFEGPNLIEDVRKKLKTSHFNVFPRWVVPLDSFPKSDSGKTLRHQLPFPKERDPSDLILTKPKEKDILQTFMRILESKMEPTDDFFRSGGDSMAAAMTCDVLNIEPVLLYAYPTARELAAFVNGAEIQRKRRKVNPAVMALSKSESTYSFSIDDGSTTFNDETETSQVDGFDSEWRAERRKGKNFVGRCSVRSIQSSTENRAYKDVNLLPLMLERWKNSEEQSSFCVLLHPFHDHRIIDSQGLLRNEESWIQNPMESSFESRELSEFWSREMVECVDGPIAILEFHQKLKSFDVGDQPEFSLLLATCHGGQVACFDGIDGKVHWTTKIPGRTVKKDTNLTSAF